MSAPWAHAGPDEEGLTWSGHIGPSNCVGQVFYPRTSRRAAHIAGREDVTAHIDNPRAVCHNVAMPATMTPGEAAVRRAKILTAARWCFLNFGFAKTAFEDIAKRAHLSRTLLYRIFKDKEDIYRAVFLDWLVSRHPAAREAANGRGSVHERLLQVCRLLVIEPWAEMVDAPMGSEFLESCERIDPAVEARHRKVAMECVAAVLGDEASAEVFLLALDGLLADQPSTEVLEQRTRLLAARFAQPSGLKGRRP